MLYSNFLKKYPDQKNPSKLVNQPANLNRCANAEIEDSIPSKLDLKRLWLGGLPNRHPSKRKIGLDLASIIFKS